MTTRVSNLGKLGEKREHYLCAMPPPPRDWQVLERLEVSEVTDLSVPLCHAAGHVLDPVDDVAKKEVHG